MGGKPREESFDGPASLVVPADVLLIAGRLRASDAMQGEQLRAALGERVA
jgi:hypothetical protein